MTNKQSIKLIEKVNSDAFLKNIENESVRKELSIKIAQCINARRFNRLTQENISQYIKSSLSTVKRLENGRIYDISTLQKYFDLLEDLPCREVRKNNYKFY